MRIETLNSPGLLSNGIRLRIEAAKAISAVEIAAGFGSGKTATANTLKAFFDQCSAAVAGLVDNVAATLVDAYILATAPDEIVLVFSEALNPDSVPAATAFTTTGQIATAETISIADNKVTLGFAADFIAGAVNIVYTKPGAGAVLEDISGNDVASIVATPVTNGIA